MKVVGWIGINREVLECQEGLGAVEQGMEPWTGTEWCGMGVGRCKGMLGTTKISVEVWAGC